MKTNFYLIYRLRNIAIVSRVPTIDAILKRRLGKGAILDQVTRWGSTYEMIQRLLELKQIFIDMANPDITLTNFQWQEAEDLAKLLQYPYTVTKNLQAAEITPGLFLKEWRAILYKLLKKGGIVADEIRKSMLKTEETWMNNDVLLAVIYVVPMHRILLSNNQLEGGKLFLCDVAIRMQKFVSDDYDDSSESGNSSSVINYPNTSPSDTELEFDNFLDNENAKRLSTKKEKGNKKEKES